MTLPFPLDFSVTAGDAGAYFESVAWAVALVVLVLVVAAWKFLEYDGVDAEQRRHLRSILPQLFRAEGVAVTIDRRAGIGRHRDRLRELLTRDAEAETNAPEPRVRDVLKTFVADLRTIGPDLPPLAVRGALEGVALLLFGSMLFLSAAWWERIVGAPDISEVGVLGAVSIALQQTVGAIPGLDLAFAWALTIGILLGQWLYGLWLPLGLFLVGASVTFVVVDWLTAEDLDVVLYPNRKWFAAGIAVLVLAPLAVGGIAYALGSLVGSLIGEPTVGVVLGGFFGIGTFLALAVTALADLARRLIERQDAPDSTTYLTATYLVLRRGLAIAAVVAVPLVITYALQVVWTGRLVTIASIIWNAPLLTRVGLLVGVLGVLVAVAIRAEVPSGFADAIDRASRSTALRAWLFARGVPFTTMALTFAFVWALFGTVPIGDVPLVSTMLGLWPPTVAAVVAGAIARGLTLAWVSLKYRFIDLADGEPGVYRVTVECLPELSDGDGEELYLARVGALDLAHRDVDELLRDVETVLEAKFEGEPVPATMSAYYWTDAKRGTVDLDEVRRELRGDVRTRIEATLREHDGRIDRQTLDEELAQAYPKPAVDGALASLQRASDLSHRRGDYVYHG